MQGNHDVALVSAAYRALTNVLHERAQDDKKTPPPIQADAQRAVRARNTGQTLQALVEDGAWFTVELGGRLGQRSASGGECSTHRHAAGC